MDWQRVPQAWSSSRKTPVAKTVLNVQSQFDSSQQIRYKLSETQYKLNCVEHYSIKCELRDVRFILLYCV